MRNWQRFYIKNAGLLPFKGISVKNDTKVIYSEMKNIQQKIERLQQNKIRYELLEVKVTADKALF